MSISKTMVVHLNSVPMDVSVNQKLKKAISKGLINSIPKNVSINQIKVTRTK